MTPNGVTANGVSRIELTVRDLERSLHFYRDLLGLRVLQEGTSDQAFPNTARLRIYEQPNREFRFALLHYRVEPAPYGLSAAPTIVLLSPLGTPPNGTSVKVDQIGITHLGLWVHRLDALYDELKGGGVMFLEPPHTLITTPEGTVRAAFAQDPDGIIIQLDELVASD
jgi:catechol 2,3-dioxygenase-like lactoylglutathione lyase family enzyme